MKKAFKRLVAVFASVAVMLGVSAPAALAAFGPERPTKAWSTSANGFDYVTFNSFTGVTNGIGDEREFFRGVQVGRDSVWGDPVRNVTQDAEIEAKIYIHNNARPSLNDAPGNPGIARNTTVRVALPTGSKQSHQATAYISADNANPGTIFDTLDFTGANNGFFELDYIEGSAKMLNGGAVTTLSDNLVSTGVNIGDMKGCFEFIREITFRMKVKMPNYSISKEVRFDGQGPDDWKESVNAQPGQTVEWKITFTNIGKTTLKAVKVVDSVPANVTVVPGTVKLFNSAFPNGYTYDASAVQMNGKQINVNINDHLPGGQSVVIFKTKIDAAENLQCGTNKIVNRGEVVPEGYGAVSDTATVNVDKKCEEKPEEPTKELPKTGAGDVLGIFAAVTVAGAIAHRVVYARRLS